MLTTRFNTLRANPANRATYCEFQSNRDVLVMERKHFVVEYVMS